MSPQPQQPQPARFPPSAVVGVLVSLGLAASAASVARAGPVIEKVSVNGTLVYHREGDAVLLDKAEGRPGDTVLIEGRGFGPDAREHFSTVTINFAAPLKADIDFHRHRINVAKLKQYADHGTVTDRLPRELLAWSDSRIEFLIPRHANSGKLIVTVQEALGLRKSLVGDGPVTYEPEYVVRGKDEKEALPRMTVREVGRPVDSRPVNFKVLGQEETVRKGRDLFFFWPQYSNVAYALMDGKLPEKLERPWELKEEGWLHWTTGLKRKVYRGADIPKAGFGEPGHEVVFEDAERQIIFPLLMAGPDKLPKVTIRSAATDWLGIVDAEFNNCLDGKITRAPGVTCAACHTTQLSYYKSTGVRDWTNEVVAGLPNPKMDFHRTLRAIKQNTGTTESGAADRRPIVDSYGPGVLDFTSAHEDDGIYNPVTVGNHYGREALQRLSTAGLEGSVHHRNNMAYIHHGGIGKPSLEQSVALQAYINSLNSDGERLRRIGLYDFLVSPDPARDYARPYVNAVAGATLEEFLAVDPADYPKRFPALAGELDKGRRVFRDNCIRCHAPSLGLYTNQDIIPFDRIGTYLPPSDRMLKTQGIRVSPLTHIRFRGRAGFLHDNHIRSLEDQLDPARGEVGSALYNGYYGPDAPRRRRIVATTPEQVRALDALNYFTEVADRNPAKDKRWVDQSYDGPPRGPRQGAKAKAYDYAKFRETFGVAEYGRHIPLPPVPHPFFVKDPEDRAALILFLNSL
jgi:hypothetical protein